MQTSDHIKENVLIANLLLARVDQTFAPTVSFVVALPFALSH